MAKPPGYWPRYFLAFLRVEGCAGVAADKTGIDPSTAYRLRRQRSEAGREFRRQWDEAKAAWEAEQEALVAAELAVAQAQRQRRLAAFERIVGSGPG